MTSYPSSFSRTDMDVVIARIKKLKKESRPLWGKMSVAQMLKHCNVPYDTREMNIKPPFLLKWMIRLFFKQALINQKPYAKNLQTAPHFLVEVDQNFEYEKDRLIYHINETVELGPAFFDGKNHYTLGVLTSQDWSNLLYKHLDHHLRQFGV